MQFLENINLPMLSKDHKSNLDQDIAAVELESDLKQMKLEKSSGLDGLSLECYRGFQQELIPHLLELFRFCCCREKLPYHGKKRGLF